jgi:hypothetical protein
MQTEVASAVVNKLSLLWHNVEMQDMTTAAWTDVWGGVAMPIYQAGITGIEDAIQAGITDIEATVLTNLLASIKSDLSNKWWLLHSQILQAEWKEIDSEVATKIEGMLAAVDPVTLAGDLLIQAIIDSATKLSDFIHQELSRPAHLPVHSTVSGEMCNLVGLASTDSFPAIWAPIYRATYERVANFVDTLDTAVVNSLTTEVANAG